MTRLNLRGPASVAFQAVVVGLTIWIAPSIGAYLFPESSEIRTAIENDAAVKLAVGPVEDVAMYRVVTTQDERGAVHERHIVTVRGDKGGASFNVFVIRDGESGRPIGAPIITPFAN